MAKYQQYAEYKDSGVEWLGEIPSHWNLSSLKRCVDGCTNGIWGSEPEESSDNTVVLRVADFDRDKLEISEEKLTLRNISPKERENRLLRKGDLLIEKSGGGDKTLVGCVVLFDKDFRAVTSNFVAKMTPKINYESSFLKYAFSLLYDGRVNYASIKQTTGIQNLDSDAYLMEKFVFPIKDEQTQIANFLDHETAQIDTLIEKQQTLIQLLKEKRQAVISHAVTKGLNPDAPMKDSGVEWLGGVPEHWEVWKFQHIAPIITCGIASTPTYVDEDEGMPFLSAQNIRDNKLSLHKYNYIPYQLHEQLTKYRKPEMGDLLVTRVGAGIGDACVIDIEMEFSIYVSLTHIRVDPLIGLNKFVMYFFGSDYCKYLNYQGTVTGGGVGNLNVGNVERYKIPLPDLVEQTNIVHYLETESAKFDNLIRKSEQAIQLMQERRTALISAAVTGKIDVRSWRAPDTL